MPRNRICELRKAEGLNQRELGEKLGVGQTTVSAWEIGRNEPDIESLRKMATLFEASIEYIMGYGAKSYDRGLTVGEYQKAQERREKRRQEKELEEDIAEAEEDFEKERTGLTRKEREELSEDSMLYDWKKEHPDIFFETYVIETIFESMTEEQRKYGRKIIEAYSAGIHSGSK